MSCMAVFWLALGAGLVFGFAAGMFVAVVMAEV